MEHEPACAIVLLCGLPAAGKSSLSERIKAACVARGCAVHVLSMDKEETRLRDLRKDEGDKHDWAAEDWHEARDNVLKSCCALLQASASDSNSSEHKRQVLIIDDNLYYASMRRPFYAAARDHRASIFLLWLDTPLDKALARNALRTGSARVGDDVIQRMHTRLVPPGGLSSPFISSDRAEGGSSTGANVSTSDETAWEKGRTFRLDATLPIDDLAASAVGQVSQLLWSPEMVPSLPIVKGLSGQELEAARAATAASAMHSADSSLRAMVGATMKWWKEQACLRAGDSITADKLIKAISPCAEASACYVPESIGDGIDASTQVTFGTVITTGVVASAANDARKEVLQQLRTEGNSSELGRSQLAARYVAAVIRRMNQR